MADWNNILIAVDEMESSLRAVRYVGQIAGSVKSATICLLHVYPEPPPDHRTKGGTLAEYRTQRLAKAESVFEKCLEILAAADIKRNAIHCSTYMAEGKTISEIVLDVQRRGQFGTVVTGKRGLSKAEEFIFGSISNSLARQCSEFTTWIVG